MTGLEYVTCKTWSLCTLVLNNRIPGVSTICLVTKQPLRLVLSSVPCRSSESSTPPSLIDTLVTKYLEEGNVKAITASTIQEQEYEGGLEHGKQTRPAVNPAKRSDLAPLRIDLFRARRLDLAPLRTEPCCRPRWILPPSKSTMVGADPQQIDDVCLASWLFAWS